MVSNPSDSSAEHSRMVQHMYIIALHKPRGRLITNTHIHKNSDFNNDQSSVLDPLRAHRKCRTFVDDVSRRGYISQLNGILVARTPDLHEERKVGHVFVVPISICPQSLVVYLPAT